MIQLNESQFQALLGLMSLIIACEGGEVLLDDEGAHIDALIPEMWWCTSCVSKKQRIEELFKKWGTKRSGQA